MTQLHLFMVRKICQAKADSLASIFQVSIMKKKMLTHVIRTFQLIRSHLLLLSRSKLIRWRKYAKWKTAQFSKAFSKMSKFMESKVAAIKTDGIKQMVYFSFTIMRVIEKIEEVNALKRHSLLSEIMTLVSRESIEKITTTAAPYKFTQNKTLKKNGYRYLALILRRAARRRMVGLFKWYQHHTFLMRHAYFIGRILERSMMQRG